MKMIGSISRLLFCVLAMISLAGALSPPTILCCDVPTSIRPTLAQYENEGQAKINYINADNEGLLRRLEEGDVDAFVIRSSNSISSDMLQRLNAVRVIGRAGVGCDNIDLEACKAANIPVVTAAGANAVAVAEHTLALMLALARRIKPSIQSIQDGRWEKASLVGTGLRGKTVGIIGMGAIGAEVASICKALGMQVLVSPPAMQTKSQSADNEMEIIDQRRQRLDKTGATQAKTLNDLLQKSDIVSVHLPLTDATRYCLGEKQLALMKKSATLISTARGGVIDESALLKSLRSGQIAGAALDVFESEGKDFSKDSVLMELAKLDSVIITPHIGGHTSEAQIDVWTIVIDKLLAKLNE